MGWRVARGLDQLLVQIDELAPGRSRASDGSIGDPTHQARRSDHNPDAQGVVRARDITHDPRAGADMADLSEALRRGRDPRLKYVIFNGRIFTSASWTWQPYDGDNPHDKHMHVSVVPGDPADDTAPWEITMLTDDDVKRLSDATAAKVLGRPWQTPGRTLAGSIEAMIKMQQRAATTEAMASVGGHLEAVLRRLEQDPQSPVDKVTRQLLVAEFRTAANEVFATAVPAIADAVADETQQRLQD